MTTIQAALAKACDRIGDLLFDRDERETADALTAILEQVRHFPHRRLGQPMPYEWGSRLHDLLHAAIGPGIELQLAWQSLYHSKAAALVETVATDLREWADDVDAGIVLIADLVMRGQSTAGLTPRIVRRVREAVLPRIDAETDLDVAAKALAAYTTTLTQTVDGPSGKGRATAIDLIKSDVDGRIRRIGGRRFMAVLDEAAMAWVRDVIMESTGGGVMISIEEKR